MNERGREWGRRVILWGGGGVLGFCILSAAFRNYGGGDGFFFVLRWPLLLVVGVVVPLIGLRLLFWRGAPWKRSGR